MWASIKTEIPFKKYFRINFLNYYYLINLSWFCFFNIYFPWVDHWCHCLISLSMMRNLVTQGSNFTSSTSVEELTLPVSEVADSGRGSWTSWSSNSHDNLQVQRMSDMINLQHPQNADNITDVDNLQTINRHLRDDSELSQSRQSWTSCSLVADKKEGNCGTIKHGETVSEQQSTDTAYKTVTSTTEKGLIGELLITSIQI